VFGVHIGGREQGLDDADDDDDADNAHVRVVAGSPDGCLIVPVSSGVRRASTGVQGFGV
jgi:hypothetical protein